MTASGSEQPIVQSKRPPKSAKAAADLLSLVLFLGVAGLVLAGDLWIKTWSFDHVAGRPVMLPVTGIDPNFAIPDHDPLVLVPHVLDLKLTCNTGAVFGLGKGAQGLFMVVSLVAVVVILWSFFHSSAYSHALHLALALILAGALGNFYDRLRFHAVRDMFWIFPDTHIFPWIFNMADASLNVGMAILIVTLWMHDRQTQSDKATPR